MPGRRRRGSVLVCSQGPAPEEASSVVHARYEVRINGRLSERARSAFPAMNVTSVPTQTIVSGELAEPSDLRDLLALCSAMGLEVVSLRRLPGEAATGPGMCRQGGARMCRDTDHPTIGPA
jgi:hypothetical protein